MKRPHTWAYGPRFLSAGFFTALLFSASAANALSLAPNVLKSYEVLPRFSTVLQTGGIAGVSIHYRLHGEFDVSFGPVYEHDPLLYPYPLPVGPTTDPVAVDSSADLAYWPPPLHFGSKFEDVDVWGNPISDGPVPPVVLDVDRVFNLTELEGEQIPTLNPRFDLYHYAGTTQDGSSVRLLGAFAGDWFYLTGGTIPPPRGADYFEYKIRMLARQTPFVDANGDAVVSAADYAVTRDLGRDTRDWARSYGDAADLAIFDLLAGDLAAATASAVAVPEPAAVMLVVIGLPAVASRRRA